MIHFRERFQIDSFSMKTEGLNASKCMRFQNENFIGVDRALVNVSTLTFVCEYLSWHIAEKFMLCTYSSWRQDQREYESKLSY